MDLPKGVQRVVKRLQDGSEAVYYYWREPRTRLPDDPTSPEFSQAIDAAKARRLDDLAKAGTIGALIVEYRRSTRYRDLRASTKADYDNTLERIRPLSNQRVADVRRKHIEELHDSIALHTPAAANKFLALMGVLMEFAIKREYREFNPCRGIKRAKIGEYESWPEEAVSYALKTLAEPYRRSIVLGLYTGQRESDCVSMTRHDYDGTAIRVKQIKTGESLWIPCHKELRRELDLWLTEGHETLLVSHWGRPWASARSFSQAFCKAIGHHSALDGLVFHGLRKAAADRLAVAGCSTHEIAAITGHKTLKMIEHYTKRADQKRRAIAAIKRLEDYR